MVNILLSLGLAGILCALGVNSADPVTCRTQLYKDLAWYDTVLSNITNKQDMTNEAKLSAMCRALYLVITRAVQTGCPLSRISELPNRQRNLFASGATACLATRPQNPANKLGVTIPRTVTFITPVATASPTEYQEVSGRNIYNTLDPCDVRVRNCYLQFRVNLLMRFRFRNHTCDIIESFANCLLALRDCGFSQFLKPLIVKEAISSTQFAFWEPKVCPVERYTPTTVSTLDTTSIYRGTAAAGHSSNAANTTAPNKSTDCGRATFKCVNGNCVSLDSICNAVDNCGDASDEVWCQTGEGFTALEIEKTFIKYDCYDVMSKCTSLHIRPLLLLLQTGRQPSLDNLCQASNNVLHCAIHESCPLSAEDRTKLSSLLIQSFEKLVSRKTCQLLNVPNKTSSPNTNDDATTSKPTKTYFTTSIPSVTSTNTFITDRATDFSKTVSTADTTNFTSTPNTADTTNFTSTPSTADTTNFTSTASTADITNFASTPNTADTTNFTSTPNTADTTNFTSTASTADTTNFTSTPSTADTTNFTSTASTADTTNFTSTASTADTTNFTSTASTADTTNFTSTASTADTTNFTSTTSQVSRDPTTSPTNTVTHSLTNSSNVTSPCIKSCEGLPSDNYQSCAGCNMFATCSEGVLYDNRPCPAKLLWDDLSKRCDLSSTTCQAPHTCVSSCDGLQTGEYQSCQGCDVYLTCINGVMNDNIPCRAGLVWNDINKRCEQFSITCASSGGKAQGYKCVKSCDGLASDNYQSCLGCSVYVSCDNGILTDNRPCPDFMLWDDSIKRCENVSTTCGSS